MNSPYDPTQYFESWGEELSARSKRVRSLIGSKHWLSDGTHKESIVREFLCRHLSSQIEVSKGFVFEADEEGEVSREIDILLHDPVCDPPWLSEGELSIVSARALRGQLHVKTEFDVKEIRDVMESTMGTNNLVTLQDGQEYPFSAGIFFERNHVKTDDDFKKKILAAIKPLALQDSLKIPDVLCVVGGPSFVRKGNTPDMPYVGYSNGNLSIAILLSALASSLPQNGPQLFSRPCSMSRLLERHQYKII